jgi:hypothetical protein
MEIVLAFAVVIAVIFFGALISMGNERQRKAIDELREKTVLWAMQDLRIKRERLARDVRVDDPLGWLNKVVMKACGYDLNLQVVEAFDQPRALICTSADGSYKVVFSPLSPGKIGAINRNRKSRLSQFSDSNPLLSLPHGIEVHEFSVLNSGILFDLELPLAWNDLTGQGVEKMERMWMFVIS